MRVAYINHGANGSIGKIVTDIVKNAPDIEAKFYFGNGEAMKENKNFAVKISSKIEYCWHLIWTRLTGIHGVGASYFVTRKLIKELKKFDPDVIHLQNLHDFYINYAMLFKYIKKYNKKIVWTLHDCWAFTGGCTHYDFVKCNKWKTQCKKCSQSHVTGYRSRTPLYCAKYNYKRKQKSFLGVKKMTIVCPSEWLARQVRQSFLKEYPIEVINNGINLDNFKPIDNHTFDNIIDRSKKIVLAVANSWGERKGYDDLFEINKLLSDEYQVVVVGVTEEQKQELKSNNIIGIKRTNNQVELAELYTIASVFINTTYEDTFPTVNIEALACGCPIITYDTGGSVETINKINGAIVPRGDYNALVDSISKAELLRINQKQYTRETGERYMAINMVAKYIELYVEE